MCRGPMAGGYAGVFGGFAVDCDLWGRKINFTETPAIADRSEGFPSVFFHFFIFFIFPFFHFFENNTQKHLKKRKILNPEPLRMHSAIQACYLFTVFFFFGMLDGSARGCGQPKTRR